MSTQIRRPRQWYYSKELSQYDRTPFDLGMCQVLDAKFRDFQNNGNIRGVFDFSKMEYTVDEETYKLSFNGFGEWFHCTKSNPGVTSKFSPEMNEIINKNVNIYIDSRKFNFVTNQCVVDGNTYTLSFNKAENCFYYIEDNNKKKVSINFSPEMNQKIAGAYRNFEANSKLSVDVTFDFINMKCTLNENKYILSNNPGPYKNLILNSQRTAHYQEDKDYLDNFDAKKVVYRWFWWSGEPNQVSSYRNGNPNVRPAWRRYRPDEEKKIEEAYQKNPLSTEPQKFSDDYCAFFNSTDRKRNSMIQEKIEVGVNSSNQGKKKQRVITRVAFCWCRYSSDEKGIAGAWMPYDKEVSEVLEDALIDGIPEVEITVDSAKYIVNFSQGIQFSLADTSKKCKITRFGTKIRDQDMADIIWGYKSLDKAIPVHWDKPQTTPVLPSTNITFDENMAIKRLVDLSNPSKE